MIKRFADETVDGAPAPLVEISSKAGYTARLSAFGARLVGVTWPDGFDAVAGPKAAAGFTGIDSFAGATCGRVANRISHGRFELDGVSYRLEKNNGANHLHGGSGGFDKRVWDLDANGNGATFLLTSPDGDQGYPGELRVAARYAIDGARLSCTLIATTSMPTLVNLTNHVYWNLSGAADVRDHTLRIAAARYCVTDAAAMVTGEVRDMAGAPLDFRETRPLSQAVPPGIDNNFCLDGERGALRYAGTLTGGGRAIDIHTSECGLQIYTGNHAGFASIAMEPQAWPDAPNCPGFPSIALRPGETYRHAIEWRFS